VKSFPPPSQEDMSFCSFLGNVCLVCAKISCCYTAGVTKVVVWGVACRGGVEKMLRVEIYLVVLHVYFFFFLPSVIVGPIRCGRWLLKLLLLLVVLSIHLG